MRTYQIYQVDAFTRTPFEGNPAGVVPDAEGLTERQMQRIARELNNSETAFVFPPSSDDHDVRVRFFTPTTEVPVCGHATVAAHYVRAVLGLRLEGGTRQLTGAGVQRVDADPTGPDDYTVWIAQHPPEFGDTLSAGAVEALLAALGLATTDLGRGPIQIVSTGHSKVMVPIAKRAVLDAVEPDLPALSALSREIGCNGFHLFTLDSPASGITAHGRMFAPAIGIAEDPVTGNANGPLGAYLLRHGLLSVPGGARDLRLSMRQGEAMGRPGTVDVEVSLCPTTGAPIGVRICGAARIVFRAELAA